MAEITLAPGEKSAGRPALNDKVLSDHLLARRVRIGHKVYYLDYAYPHGAFRSEGSVARVALELETIMLGAYLGAVEGIQTAALKPVVARIAASEAQHVAYLSTIKGLSSFQAFPNPMTIQQVSNALDVYTA